MVSCIVLEDEAKGFISCEAASDTCTYTESSTTTTTTRGWQPFCMRGDDTEDEARTRLVGLCCAGLGWAWLRGGS